MRTPLLLALAAMALAAFAPAGQPNPNRVPRLGGVDIDFAVKELCAPWLAGGVESSALAARTGVSRATPQPAFAEGGEAYVVGRSELVVALTTGKGTLRACTLRVAGGDPEAMRRDMGKALSGWRVPLTPSVHKFPSGAYARRDVLCSPTSGAQDAALISIGGPDSPVSLMATVMTGIPRDPRCDRAI